MLVRKYLLPNAMDWQAFPETGQAHRIVEGPLLAGELSSCKIGHKGVHSYTSTRFHDAEGEPWHLAVALTWEDGWRETVLRLNPDGSYEKLGWR